MRLLFFLSLIILNLHMVCWPRNTNGTLDIIFYPLSTNPALVIPGGVLEIQLISEKPISKIAVEAVKNNCSVKLFENIPGQTFTPVSRLTFAHPTKTFPELDWRRNWAYRSRQYRRDLVRIQFEVPVNLEEGLYDICVSTDTGSDISERAVYVFKRWPTAYKVCHVTDVHIGKRDAVKAFRSIANAVNQLKPAFVLLTGDNVESASSQEFTEFLSVLDEFKVPTFVVPGNHDSYGWLWKGKADVLRYFGATYYSFSLGCHHYVGIDGATRRFDKFQKQFVENDLNRYQRFQFKCIFNHGFVYRKENNEEWLTSMSKKYKINLYISGHKHRSKIGFIGHTRTLFVITQEAYKCGGSFNVLTIEGNDVKSIESVVVSQL
jgi:predicted phosphodiesterase